MRALAGLRGYHFGYDWETALLYSWAKVRDSQNSVSATMFEQSMARPTPDAYNPFCGGCVDTPTHGDCSPSAQAVIDGIVIDLERKSRTT